MRYFKSFLGLMLKRFFSRRNIFLLLVLLLLSFYSTHQGIKERKKSLENIEEFKKAETAIFNNIRNYNKYSNDGFRVLHIPGAASVFFSNPVFLSELSARINSITILDIGSNCKGGLVLRGNSPFKPRFSNVILVVVTLLILFLGFELMREREFLRSLSSQWCKLGVFISTIFTITILFTLCLLVIFACCIALTMLQGISLTTADLKGLVISLPPMILKLLYFFVFGIILGSIRSRYTGIPGLLAVWIIFVFIFPAAVNSYIEEKSNQITSAYKADSEKWNKMTIFEKRAQKESGEYKSNTDEGRGKVAEYYWEHDRKEIEAVDENLKQEISQLIDHYNNLSLWCPTTFYTYTCSEVSSRGYQGYLKFYDYLQELRRKFVRFWIDRVYYHDKEAPVNFVTKDENLFFSQSRMPKKYWTGVFMHLGIVFLLLIVSYLLFKRSLEHVSTKEIKELGNVDLDLDKGELKVWYARKEHFKKVLFNMFSGAGQGLVKKGFKGEVYFDGVDTVDRKGNIDFVYICNIDEFPNDVKVKGLLAFYAGWNQIPDHELKALFNHEALKNNLDKTLKELENQEKFEVLMGILNMIKSDVYLLDWIGPGMPMECLIKLLNKMEALQANSLVIYLITYEEIFMRSLPKGIYFHDGDSWIDSIKSNHRIIEISNKLKYNKERQNDTSRK